MRCWPLARRWRRNSTSSGGFRRHATGAAGNFLPVARKKIGRRRRRGAGFRTRRPAGYGRLLTDADGQLLAIREHKDASAEERAGPPVQRRSDGARRRQGADGWSASADDNAQKEYYLPDAVEVARREAPFAPSSRRRPAKCWASTTGRSWPKPKRRSRRRLRLDAMRGGATLIAPETVFFSHDTGSWARCSGRAECGVRPWRDGRRRRVDPRLLASRRRAVGEGAAIGPYARLRPGAIFGARRAYRQFRRGEEGRDRARAPRSTT